MPVSEHRDPKNQRSTSQPLSRSLRHEKPFAYQRSQYTEYTAKAPPISADRLVRRFCLCHHQNLPYRKKIGYTSGTRKNIISQTNTVKPEKVRKMTRSAIRLTLICGTILIGLANHLDNLCFAQDAKQNNAICDPARPKMMFADTASGKPYSKDPAVVKFQGRYWLYYSLPPYKGKPTKGWSIGIACSDNLVDWKKVGELKNEGEVERNGFCAPGAIVLDSKVHLFYQSYGNGKKDGLCHAWSKDGIHFARNPSNPIFSPKGDWTCGRAIDADVIEHDGRLLLYWATRGPDMKIQMQGVSAAPIDSDFSRDKWMQLNLDGPILKPELPWEQECIEAAAMAKHNGQLYMFYAGAYNNRPQQIGVAVSEDGVHFKRLSDEPFLPNGSEGSWNHSESGHPYLFQDDDGRDYLFYQGNNDHGKTWYLSMIPIHWKDGKPVLDKSLE